MGSSTPKAFLELSGQMVLLRALRPFIERADISSIIVTVPENYLSFCTDELSKGIKLKDDKKLHFITGGGTRQQSVYLALQKTILELGCADNSSQKSSYTLVHDAARCLLTDEELEELIKALSSKPAVSLGLPLTDSIKRVADDGKVIESLKRSELWSVQTPQAFRLDLLVSAHNKFVDQEYTDDASMVEAIYPVYMLKGSETNFKITTRVDWDRAVLLTS